MKSYIIVCWIGILAGFSLLIIPFMIIPLETFNISFEKKSNVINDMFIYLLLHLTVIILVLINEYIRQKKIITK